MLDLKQVSQERTKSFTSFYKWGHQKSREISFNVLLNPKCPAAEKSWRDYRTRSRVGPFDIYNRSPKYKRSPSTLNLLSLARYLISTATGSSMVAARTWSRKLASISTIAAQSQNFSGFINIVHCRLNAVFPAFGARYNLLDNASGSLCCFPGWYW